MKEKAKERTGWRGHSESQIGREEKWQTCWCYRDQQRAYRMAQDSAEILEHTGPAEKKRMASMPQRESSWQVRQSRLPKGKGTEPSVQSTRSQGGHSVAEK